MSRFLLFFLAPFLYKHGGMRMGKRGRSKMRIQRETMDPWCLRAFLFFVLATNENAVVFLVKIIIYVIANAAFHCTFITCTAHFFFFWAIYKMLFFHIPQGLAYLFVKVVIYLSLFSSTWNIKRQQKLQTSTNVLSYCVDTELKLKEFQYTLNGCLTNAE